MKFGDKLIALRKKNGLSQEDLAEKLGVSRQSVSKWESNNTYPETDKIVQICNIFDCSMDDLINENIENIDNIERKNKNNLNVALDSFLEFITKTINMFCDMKFISGLKCVIEMIILILILSVIGLIFVEFTSGIIYDLFSFIPDSINIFYRIIRSVIWLLWAIVTIIILVHVFKIRYLDYYDKALDEKDNKKEKIEVRKNKEKIKPEKENKQKIIIRDKKHRPFAFLSLLSKMIIFSIKFMLVFLSLGLIFSLIMFIVLFVISITLVTTSSIFIGSTLTLLAAISINIIFLLIIINFVFDKKLNYKIMLIIFMSSIILFGVGVGITTISFKNFEIKEDGIKTISKEEIMKYDENIIITSEYLDDVEYVIDDSLKDEIKLVIEYDDRFYSYGITEEEIYESYNLVNIHSNSNINISKAYKIIIDDLKNNIIRNYEGYYLNVKIISSKDIVNKLIDNTKKIYFVDVENTDIGYKLSNFEHRINDYSECEASYNAKTNEVSTYSEDCTCTVDEEKTTKGNVINYSCDYN